MINDTTFDGGLPFRIKRPLITSSGFVSDVDQTVKSHLDELNRLLGARFLKREEHAVEAAKGEEHKGKHPNGNGKHDLPGFKVVPSLDDFLRAKPLTPKRAVEKNADNEWAAKSLLYELEKVVNPKDPKDKAGPEKFGLSEYIDLTPKLASLRYELQTSLSSSWSNVEYNAKTVLNGYPATTDYLIAYAYHVLDLREVTSLKNFILGNSAGAKNIINYAMVSAARTVIHDEHIEVANYNDDGSDIVGQIKAASLSLSTTAFKPALKKLIDSVVFDSKESQIIESAGIGEIPVAIKPLLVKYIKSSPVPITKDNAKFFLPLFVLQISGTQEVSDPSAADAEESDKDFQIEFLEDDKATIQVSKSAVKCAAQLYYAMILGDELDVFNVVNWFTHKFLVRGGIEIQDRRLRENLQSYVFSNKFTDLKTKKTVDRTRPAERQMFYKQVFDYGRGETTDDLVVNKEFTRLWNVLMLESARYLERAQISPNPDNFVSRTNVMQAVEDLQYNLSTHCTGMANVVTPLIYAELNFVIQRIFMHPEILRQVVPAGGTWWRVVETLYMDMKNARPRSTVLYNKAKLGSSIIRALADYNPATFQDNKEFSAFISDVDAYITTQSILQEALTDELKRGDQSEDEDTETTNGVVAHDDRPAMPESSAGADEWDF